MNITAPYPEFSLIWLMITTIVALISGFISSWLYYTFIKRKELKETKKLELEKSKKERVNLEIIRWANPIHRSVQGLHYRLRFILEKGGYTDFKSGNKKYDYMMNSTLFYFAQYFAWIELLQEELNIEIFQSQVQETEFFNSIIDVGKTLSRYPPGYECKGEDIRIWSLQQRAIGEMMLVKEGDQKRCMNYVEFLKVIKNPDFFEFFLPIKLFIDGIDRDNPDHNCRWQRLLKFYEQVINLEKICEKRLSIDS